MPGSLENITVTTVFTRLRRVGAVTAAALGAAALLVAPAGAQDGADPLAPDVTREDCPIQVGDPAAECGSIEVPQEYSDPSGPTISVGFVRYPAANQDTKLGTVFGNPGGPGGDAYGYFSSGAGFDWPQAIVEEWDRVAVQPRGLPGSTPLDCTTPGPNAAVDYHLSSGAFFQDSCEQATPGYTASVTTSNTAEDWEMVRRALELEEISIIGLSYGTYLGSLYATRYPDRVDRLVLDSAMDPAIGWPQLLADQKPGYTQALHDFFGWVAARDDEYGLGETPYQVYQYWAGLIYQESGQTPTLTPPPMQPGELPAELTSAQNEQINAAVADAVNMATPALVQVQALANLAANPEASLVNSAIYANTYSVLPWPAEWDTLARLLNGSLFDDPAYQQQVDDVERTVPTEEQLLQLQADAYNAQAMQTMVICNETRGEGDLSHLPSYLWNGYVIVDPVQVGQDAYASGQSCRGIEPSSQMFPLDGSELEITPLQISGTGDPQTRYQGHRTIAEAMGAEVVTVNGPGHGHLARGNELVDEIVVDYLSGADARSTEVEGLG